MTSTRQDWEFYLREVDGEPVSICLDLALAAKAPLESRPYMAYVRVLMRAPRPDGLSSSEEYDRLIQLEDHITAALTRSARARYVGRNTSGGSRDFYFYVSDPVLWAKRVAKAFDAFPEYKHKAGSRRDIRWKTYLEFLYPCGEDMERIQNRRVCDALRDSGDTLSKRRDIDHWASFPDQKSRARFLRSVTRQGFKVRELLDSGDRQQPYGVQLFRADLPSHEAIDAVTLPLFRAAEKVGGDYSGWETQLITKARRRRKARK